MPQPSPPQNYLVFHTAGQALALPAQTIAEIVPMVPLTEVPAMPSFVAGFLDWNTGEPPLPVLRLERVLRLSQPADVPGLHTPIVVVRPAPEAEPVFGLLVERVEGLVAGSVDTDDSALTRQSFNGAVTGLFAHGDVSVAVLSVPKLLIAEEQERLAAFRALLDERKQELDAP